MPVLPTTVWSRLPTFNLIGTPHVNEGLSGKLRSHFYYWTTWWPHNNSQHVDYYGELFLFTKILIDWLFIIDLWYTISYNIRSLIMYGKWQYTSAIILGQWLYMVSDNIRHWWCTVNVNIRSVYGQLQYTITDNVW